MSQLCDPETVINGNTFSTNYTGLRKHHHHRQIRSHAHLFEEISLSAVIVVAVLRRAQNITWRLKTAFAVHYHDERLRILSDDADNSKTQQNLFSSFQWRIFQLQFGFRRAVHWVLLLESRGLVLLSDHSDYEYNISIVKLYTWIPIAAKCWLKCQIESDELSNLTQQQLLIHHPNYILSYKCCIVFATGREIENCILLLFFSGILTGSNSSRSNWRR